MWAELGNVLWKILLFLWATLVFIWKLLVRFFRWLWNLLCPRKQLSLPVVDDRTLSDHEKRSLFIAFASYFSTEWLGDRQYIEEHTKETLGTFLQREDVADIVSPRPEGQDNNDGKSNAYELVWGPAVFQSKASMIADNTMYVAR